jgi:Protein of unknown function (DUF1552)
MRQLSRRTLLRGAGTAIALPFLDAMVPAFAKVSPASPLRMMYVYAPTGIMPQAWMPPTTGPDFEYQRVMKPLERFRKDVLLLSGLSQHDVGIGGPDGPGDHARAVGTYLTGCRIRKTQGADIQAGVSVDQVAARAFAAKTRIPSLEVTCEDNYAVGACDSYSCAYQTLAFKSATEPLPPEANPRLLFERMFGQLDVSADPVRRKNQQLYRTSILDLTMQDTQSLKRDLGATDNRKLDEYLTSLRQMETRLQSSANDTDEIPAGVEEPEGVPFDYAEHARLMFDLIAIAFQTDTTRIATFMMAREGGVHTYPEIGVPEAHHPISHHGGDPVLIEKLIKIQTYHMQQFAYFVEKLKGIQEGTGSLLDHSAIVYGAGLADPNRHDHDHCPTLVAGNAGGRIKTGQHVAFKAGTPFSDLHITLLDTIGVPTDKLGNSDGKLNFLAGVS